MQEASWGVLLGPYLWESEDSIIGQKEKVNWGAVVRKASLIPKAAVQLQYSPAEFS